MKNWMGVLGVLVLLLAVANSCGPKRWIQGDPRDATPLPTPVVIDSVEIGVGVDAGTSSEEDSGE